MTIPIWTPPPRHRVAPPIITPWHPEFAGTMASGGAAAPASGTWPAANLALLFPMYLIEAFVVAKAGWTNGATVGTDSLDIGAYEMTDYTTGRMDLIRSTGGIVSANANVVQASGTWKTAHANITSGNDSTDATSYTTASVTLKAGRLYLMSVENSHGSSATAVSSITGGGTWASRSTTQYNTNLNRVSIWSCVPTADYTGTISISFGATTQTGACWALEEFSGVDTTTNDGIVQQAVGTGSSGTALATLAAFGSANNATFGAHGHAAATATAPGTGFTETADQTAATPAQALETEWNVGNDTTVDATFTSAAWGSCAVEIKASTASFVLPPSRPGNPSLWLALVCSGTTATVFRSSPALWGSRMLGLEKASAYPLPSNIIPTALTTNRIIPLAGFSRRTLWE